MTIGILGGMSPESTSHYYTGINQAVKEKLGGDYSADVLLLSVNFQEIVNFINQGDWDAVGKLLHQKAKILEQAGVSCLAIASNAAHKVAEIMMDGIHIPLIHIADVTAERIKQDDNVNVGLLGTKPTMEESFYRGRLESKGIQVITPNNTQRDDVHRIIFEELVRGKITEKSRQQYLEIMKDLQQQGTQGIILGCTEIGLLINSTDSKIPIYDTASIHIATIAQRAIDELQKPKDRT